MKKKGKLYLGAGIAAVLVVTLLAVTTGGKEVETVQACIGSITRTVTDTGYVQPATDFNLYATQNARVIQVPVETGQAVRRGQTLVVLENLDLAVQISDVKNQLSQAGSAAEGARAALERAGLELKDAEENLARLEELFRGGAATKVELDRARLQADTSRQSMSEISTRLESSRAQAEGYSQSLQQLTAKEQQLVVKSPVDGTVLDLPAKKDQVLSPGALLANVADSGQLEIKADILSDDLADVRVGQKAGITAPVLGQNTLSGVVKKIYPRAEEKQSALGIIQRRVPVIISLKESAGLKPGFEVRVAVETATRENVLTVPREAVRTTKEGQKEVMAVAGGRVRHRTVTTGISDGNNIEITGGLEEGDQIIRDGSLDLAEKTRVK